MGLFSKKEEQDPFTFEDNIVDWYDAIKSKLDKMRSIHYQASISENEGAIIGVMPVIEDEDYLLNELEQKERYLPVIEKMSRYRRCEWLSVRLLLKEMLGMEKEIVYLPSGKPCLADSSYSIGISHTKGYVAVIASKTQAVAIDIEYISPRVERIKSRFMSFEELSNLSPTQPLIHLLLHWSTKESLFKIMDEDEIEFKTQLHICPFTPVSDEESSFNAYETRTEDEREYTVNYLVTENYVLTYIIN